MLEPMAQEMGKEMLRFHRLYGEKISRRFRQLHIDRLSQTEYLLLAIIVERKHLPMSELCERAMMRKQQVTQTVNQLEDKSLVVRVRNNENRRVVWLEPTEQALEIAREVQQALVVGGVASSKLLRGLLQQRLNKLRSPVEVFFGAPRYSADNAAGVAELGLEQYRQWKEHHA